MEIKIENIENITKDIIKITATKPKDYNYKAGQAVMITYKKQTRPFTFTSCPNDKFLEFIIKIYKKHNGFTKELLNLKKNDILEISKPIGFMKFKGNGLFIAGGTGITPFISILKHHKIEKTKNFLIYSVTNENDIINNNFLNEKLEKNYKQIITEKEKKIDEELLQNYTKYDFYYICGPPSFNKFIKSTLTNLGIKNEQIIE